jgi:succinoglycan biosynthesis protein ExoO
MRADIGVRGDGDATARSRTNHVGSADDTATVTYVSPLEDGSSLSEGTRGERPRISVIVPAYNTAATLRRAIDSVLCQTEQSFEIVLVDDGSTDDTLSIARQLEASDPRIRVLALRENGGQARARNLGTAAARGEWIAILDADDRYLPTRLAVLLRHGEEQGVDLVADNQTHHDELAGVRIGTAFPPSNGGHPITLTDFIKQSDTGAAFSLGLLKPMIRAEFIRRSKLQYREGTKLGEDFYHLMQFFDAGGRGYLVHEPLYEWTLPFGPVSRQWTTTGNGAWRYDYRNALEANSYFLDLVEKRGRPELVALLRRREREYRVMIHYLDAQRVLAEKGDRVAALRIIASHPSTWPLLARRVVGRLHRAARGR